MGLGGALGASVEAGQHVTDRGVGRLDQVGLGLGLGVGFGYAVALEGQGVAGVGICEDGADLADSLLGQAVDGDGAADPAVADMIGDDPATPAAIGRPDYGPVLFFWT